jgi:hypothetical protein
MTTEIASWRLGDPEPTQYPASKRQEAESLIPGVAEIDYTDVDGNPLQTVSRRVLFPVATDQIRAASDGTEVVVSFPVRGFVSFTGIPLGQAFEREALWFTAAASEYARASFTERRAAVAKADLTPRVSLKQQLAPLPTPRTPKQSGRRRIDYGDGRSAIITDGESKRIDFDDGDSVTVTELPEGASDLPATSAPRYLIPSRFQLVIFDSEGRRVGLTTGTRYRACDAMREDDR